LRPGYLRIGYSIIKIAWTPTVTIANSSFASTK
jgi:hypothetical protein